MTYWNINLLNKLSDAPWPMTKYELYDYINRTSGEPQLLTNIIELEEDYDMEYESIEDVCPYYNDFIEGIGITVDD